MLDLSRPAGVFRLVQEDESRGMTAWVVGRWMASRCLHEGARLSPVGGKEGLRQWLSYEFLFGSSRLKATVSLDRGASGLSWAVEAEWLEVGRKGQGVPQLNFFLPGRRRVEGVPLRRSLRDDRPSARGDRPARQQLGTRRPPKNRPQGAHAHRRPVARISGAPATRFPLPCSAARSTPTLIPSWACIASASLCRLPIARRRRRCRRPGAGSSASPSCQAPRTRAPSRWPRVFSRSRARHHSPP